MDLQLFQSRFSEEVLFKKNDLERLSNIEGTNSPLIQHTINLAVNCLKGTEEAYLEVGCLNGSSLAAAGVGNDDVIKYACDATVSGPLHTVIQDTPNLTFHRGNYFELDLSNFLKNPVGIYYYDANHDRSPTYQALEKIIPHLADKAIIFMDDIHYSRVYNAWREFMRKHSDQFMVVHEFWTPDQFRACTLGYSDGWWDGFAMAEFERVPEERDENIEGLAITVWHGIGEVGKGRRRTLYPRELKHIHGKEELKV